MNIKISLLFVFILSQVIFSQDLNVEKSFLSNPKIVSEGIVFTDTYSSSFYLLKDGKTEKIFSAAGCGNYFTISDDKSKIGFKYISDDGKQIPALLNLTSKELIEFVTDKNLAGQLSFTNDNRFAYTSGKELIITDGTNFEKYDLGTYSNIAPISPDGFYSVYNDDNDQIWLLNLKQNSREQISDNLNGYFYPQWSPNSRYIVYSSLGGDLYLYELSSRKTISIGKGYNPSWSDNSEKLVYHSIESDEKSLLGSALHIFDLNKNAGYSLKGSQTEFPCFPSFTNDNEIIYTSFEKNELYIDKISFSPQTLLPIEKQILNEEFEITFYQTSFNDESTLNIINIPYVHQVYDTPDWHNGHASCAPTAAIMVLAYYNLVPRWEGYCSTPYGHINFYGRYVAEKYWYRESFYTAVANDWGNNAAYGGYGFMWSGSSPRYRMANYYQKHGVTAVQTYNPPYSEAVNEINEGEPYTMCVMLTTAGHLIIANGIHMERTLIFNDPYGNKNTPGYPSYDGKNVRYDWPGYNNGYQNLTGVPWCIKTKYTKVTEADTLVDNMQLDIGFYMHTKAPSSMSRWRDRLTGFNNHFWFTFTTESTTNDTCYATWRPNLPQDGNYEVMVYIPFSNATSSYYRIHHNDGIDTVNINQKNFTNEWVSLGSYNFEKGNKKFVQLGDATGIAGQQIVFDAMNFSYKSSYVTGIKENVEFLLDFQLMQNYPNPFNPNTKITFSIPPGLETSNKSSLRVYDILGNEIATLVNDIKSPGTYEVGFDASGLASGVYFYRLFVTDLNSNKIVFNQTKKMILLE